MKNSFHYIPGGKYTVVTYSEKSNVQTFVNTGEPTYNEPLQTAVFSSLKAGVRSTRFF